MATYAELLTIANTGSVFIAQVKVASQIAAGNIITTVPTPSANNIAWARAAFADPEAAMRSLIWPVLYSNKAFTSAQILGATDAQVQTAVDAAVAVLAA